MFEESLIESAMQKMRTTVRWYFLSMMLLYTLMLVALVIGSTMLVSPQIKEQFISTALVLPPPPPPPLGRGAPTRLAHRMVPRDFIPTSFSPRTLNSLPSAKEFLPDVGGSSTHGAIDGHPMGSPEGLPGGDLNGVWGATGPTIKPAPPPETKPLSERKPSPSTPRRISGGVLQGNAVRRVQPVYPSMAKNARISGSVEVEVLIDESGNVLSATVVQGHPLLQQATLEAARQWKFRPTLLSGVPIKVTGILVFNFRL